MPHLSEIMGTDAPGTIVVGAPEDMQWFTKPKKRVHLFALGDVGSLLLTGLVLMGGDCISEIGIYDVRDHVGDRFEFEMNQMRDGAGSVSTVPVRVISEEELFNCDVFLFCASLRVPPVGEGGDVRMAQFEANGGLVRKIASQAVQKGYEGLFCVVSDPVDPLCQEVMKSGIRPARVKGYGLGVMNARAAYFAGKDARFASYLKDGRAYGPHGQDLVIVNSLSQYDPKLSRELTSLTVEANMVMRGWGFKPYMAPAISSGAFSILATLRGDWHYSSQALGRVYFGARNRVTSSGIEVENVDLPEEAFLRCQTAYRNMEKLL